MGDSSQNDLCREAFRLYQSGDAASAARLCQELLGRQPGQSDAIYLLGVIALDAGQTPDAAKHLRQAVLLAPDNAVFHNALGEILLVVANQAEALDCFKKALALRPTYARAHNNVGRVQHAQGDLAAARVSFAAAIQLEPRYATAHNNLGAIARMQGQLHTAISHFRQALALQPDYPEAHFNLGAALQELGDWLAAEGCFREAIRLRPNYARAHSQLAQVVEQRRGHRDAEHGKQAAPNVGARIRAILESPAIFQSAEEMRLHRKQMEDRLAVLEQEKLSIRDPLTEINMTNYYSAYHGLNDRSLQSRLAALYLRATPSLAYVAPHCIQPRAVEPGRPLRVGFISRFLNMHTIGEVNLGFIRNLSRKACRVVLVQPPSLDHPLARLIQDSADEVVTLSPSLEVARREIAEQRFDVLFYTDIGMEPFTYFLAFARLAPVQCTTWGHPVTTGIPNMDYYLSSHLLEPSGAQDHYTEQLVLLNNLPTYYYAPAFFPPAKTPAHFGLAEEDHLYMCSQAPWKVHPDYDAMLGAILRADPRGRVLFIRSQNPDWTPKLLARFQRVLPDVVERIQFLPHQGGQDYLHLLAVCNVLLDTTHFGGGNTAYKAFSVGAAIVTMPCAFARSRVTSACYRKMGIQDCIAANPEEYVRIAVRLGTDQAWLQEVRSRIESARDVLYEDADVLRELEAFFAQAVAKASAASPGNG